MRRPTVGARPGTAGVARRLLVLGAAAALLLSGCSSDDAPPEDGRSVVATVPVGELATVDGALETGEEISVLVDTPDLDWTVMSSAPEIVEVIEDDPDANPRVVRIVAASAGESEVSFIAPAADAEDSITITVD